jgi:threonine dehydrogenase-like Zn-dependent dehydrogenase
VPPLPQGHQHVCEHRQEVGVRGGRPGALAEPGGNALRSAQAADLGPGDRALVLGPGTIGLLVAMFARAAGAEVHLLGRSERPLALKDVTAVGVLSASPGLDATIEAYAGGAVDPRIG